MIATTDEYLTALDNGHLDQSLSGWYGRKVLGAQKSRYRSLLTAMKARFGDKGAVSVVSTPGRTELGGNHTDHNHGLVLTAAVHLDLAAVAVRHDEFTIRIHSQGFPEDITVDLSDLEPRPGEAGSPESLVRGVAAGFAHEGYRIGGFKAVIQGTVPVGSGLSSSAAFEILIGTILNHFFNSSHISATALARIGQSAEGRFFGKPCGLMDQLASALGGVLRIDFENPLEPRIHRIGDLVIPSDYRLAVVDTGGSHADLTADYAAIPREMRAVAAHFGRRTARDLTMEELVEATPQLRPKTGDRAILRVMHFLEDNRRVTEQAAALRENRFADYLRLVSESGKSSWQYLQNICPAGDITDQTIPLALALTERFLAGRGACRIHGGGFAGTIQAYVPAERLSEFQRYMEPVFGEGVVIPLEIRSSGSSVLSMEK